jgi:hypothetical protein
MPPFFGASRSTSNRFSVMSDLVCIGACGSTPLTGGTPMQPITICRRHDPVCQTAKPDELASEQGAPGHCSQKPTVGDVEARAIRRPHRAHAEEAHGEQAEDCHVPVVRRRAHKLEVLLLCELARNVVIKVE